MGADFYEFRFYSVEQGRMAAELALVREMGFAPAPEVEGGPPAKGPSLWDLYGVPRPVGCWVTVSGAGTGGFLYIIRWPDMATRDAHFPRFWTDPYWRARRAQLTDGMTLVQSIETWMMVPLPEFAPHLQQDGTRLAGLHELIMIPVAQEAAASQIAARLPMLRESGAVLLGGFGVRLGPDLPKLVLLLAWPDADAALRPEARRLLAEALHDTAVAQVEQHFLDPVAWNLPASGLAAAEGQAQEVSR